MKLNKIYQIIYLFLLILVFFCIEIKAVTIDWDKIKQLENQNLVEAIHLCEEYLNRYGFDLNGFNKTKLNIKLINLYMKNKQFLKASRKLKEIQPYNMPNKNELVYKAYIGVYKKYPSKRQELKNKLIDLGQDLIDEKKITKNKYYRDLLKIGVFGKKYNGEIVAIDILVNEGLYKNPNNNVWYKKEKLLKNGYGIIKPSNKVLRVKSLKKRGYIKIPDNQWVSRKYAKKLRRFYKYQEIWYTIKELKKMGLATDSKNRVESISEWKNNGYVYKPDEGKVYNKTELLNKGYVISYKKGWIPLRIAEERGLYEYKGIWYSADNLNAKGLGMRNGIIKPDREWKLKYKWKIGVEWYTEKEVESMGYYIIRSKYGKQCSSKSDLHIYNYGIDYSTNSLFETSVLITNNKILYGGRDNKYINYWFDKDSLPDSFKKIGSKCYTKDESKNIIEERVLSYINNFLDKDFDISEVNGFGENSLKKVLYNRPFNSTYEIYRIKGIRGKYMFIIYLKNLVENGIIGENGDTGRQISEPGSDFGEEEPSIPEAKKLLKYLLENGLLENDKVMLSHAFALRKEMERKQQYDFVKKIDSIIKNNTKRLFKGRKGNLVDNSTLKVKNTSEYTIAYYYYDGRQFGIKTIQPYSNISVLPKTGLFAYYAMTIDVEPLSGVYRIKNNSRQIFSLRIEKSFSLKSTLSNLNETGIKKYLKSIYEKNM